MRNEHIGKELKGYFLKECLISSSLMYDAPIYFNEDELLKLRGNAPLLYAFYTTFPKDVRGFWLLESIGRWINKEIEKSSSTMMSRGKIRPEHLPFPLCIEKKDYQKIKKSVEKLVYIVNDAEYTKGIDKAVNDLFMLIDKMNSVVYPSFMRMFGVSNREFAITTNKTLSAYNDILEQFQIFSQKDNFNKLMKSIDASNVLGDVVKRLYPEEMEDTRFRNSVSEKFFTAISNREQSSMWQYVTRKNPKITLYAPIGFHKQGLDAEMQYLSATTMSDFYLHFIYPAEDGGYAEGSDDNGYDKSSKAKNDKDMDILLYDSRIFRALQHLFFYGYNSQSHSMVSESLKRDLAIERASSIMRVAEDIVTFTDVIDSSVNYVYKTVQTEFNNRLQSLFENEDFIKLSKQEQMLYIMAVLKSTVISKSETIHTIKRSEYANIRLEKLLLKISDILNDGFSTYFNAIVSQKVSFTDDESESNTIPQESVTVSHEDAMEQISVMDTDEIPLPPFPGDEMDMLEHEATEVPFTEDSIGIDDIN